MVDLTYMEITFIILALLFGWLNYANGNKTRKRLNKIERMLAWKGVLTLDETLDHNLPEEVKADLIEMNK